MSYSCCAICKRMCGKASGMCKWKHAKTVPPSVEMQEVIIPQYDKVPLEKIFPSNSQSSVPMCIHPQQSRKHSLITEQPTSFYPAIAESPVIRRCSFEDSLFYSFPLSASIPNGLGPSLPTIDFIIYYDIQSYSFTVKLLRAKNLPSMNRDGTSDPFITLFLIPHREDIFRSKTIYKTTSPVFNETFVFTNIPYNEIFTRTLVLRVFDENALRHNELIGNVVLPLRKTELHGVRVSAVLNEDSDVGQATTNGDIQLSLRYNPGLSIISGLIIKASNLKRDIMGQSDPYVKMKLYYKGKKKFKWKSRIMKNTLSPVFNQDFTFDIANMDISQISMKLVLKDVDHFRKNETIGKVEFGDNIDHVTGLDHWKDMKANPYIRITRWHSLDRQSAAIFQLLRFIL